MRVTHDGLTIDMIAVEHSCLIDLSGERLV